MKIATDNLNETDFKILMNQLWQNKIYEAELSYKEELKYSMDEETSADIIRKWKLELQMVGSTAVKEMYDIKKKEDERGEKNPTKIYEDRLKIAFDDFISKVTIN
ncbi:Hypothetical protein CINCED_3A002766 [Cinara cedri]|uniref:Uncharacterized protein n=1 Tax=Cinara cedri TaxID=506608 RepID=A0A5E4M5R6_9HEMI|nr:Hypothetical protein CINCED_3A002766 [Cinara cedri]